MAHGVAAKVLKAQHPATKRPQLARRRLGNDRNGMPDEPRQNERADWSRTVLSRPFDILRFDICHSAVPKRDPSVHASVRQNLWRFSTADT
jgi:hypothetical protein